MHITREYIPYHDCVRPPLPPPGNDTIRIIFCEELVEPMCPLSALNKYMARRLREKCRRVRRLSEETTHVD